MRISATSQQLQHAYIVCWVTTNDSRSPITCYHLPSLFHCFTLSSKPTFFRKSYPPP